MDFIEEQSPIVLKESISLGALLSEEGTTIDIDPKFQDDEPTFMDDMNLDSEDEVDAEIDTDALLLPSTKPFAELKQDMTQVNEYIYKRIRRPGKVNGETVPENARVELRYSGYWENETAPFDSTLLRGKKYHFITARNEVLPGLECAVRTMKMKEEAEFIISYKMLFGEQGCVPRIRPKADGLFVIEIISYNEIGDLHAEQNVPEEDRNKFSIVINELKKIHVKGLDFCQNGDFKGAARSFEKVVNCLNFCSLANEQEQTEQEDFLVKLHTNLLICYNNLQQPGKVCVAMKTLRRLTNNNPPCKALFHEGRALHVLGDYDRSREVLRRAHSMQPSNPEINKELMLLDKMCSKYKENVKNMWSKAFGGPEQNGNNKKIVISESNDDLARLMESFKNDVNIKEMNLPRGLTAEEIETIDKLAIDMNLKLRILHGEEIHYSLAKNE